MDEAMKNKDSNSRTAPKVMVRLNSQCHEGLTDLAQQHGRSMNAECVMGLISWLDHQKRCAVIRKMLISQLDEADVAVLLAKLPVVTEEPGLASDKISTMLRYTPYIRDRIAEQAKSHEVSVHSMLLTALAWWVNVSRQVNALLEAIIDQGGALQAQLLDQPARSAA
ncbi:Arc family DNA-binding protein (plasmid) [Pseudomonas aeruginosa]|uniref:Arc family DNA-binding protein n=1 Tax=Pseudomonas aeruginosa TaxID=287 RepID=UPI0024963C9B|nr:Arc family DNA-binding protein [Pseudomonas aeruginosa]MDI2525181.1 Arc family DNA-binding protein [Pseudomonas aeruginosa]